MVGELPQPWSNEKLMVVTASVVEALAIPTWALAGAASMTIITAATPAPQCRLEAGPQAR